MESFPICFIMPNTFTKPILDLTNSNYRVTLVMKYIYKTTMNFSLSVLRSTAAHQMYSGLEKYFDNEVTPQLSSENSSAIVCLQLPLRYTV